MADEFVERLLPGGPSPAQQLTLAERNARILEAAVKGRKYLDIAADFGLSLDQIHRVINAAAREVKERSVELVQAAYWLQIERVERLYKLVEIELQRWERAATEGGLVKFDDRPFRVAVSLFERQAKLMGFDRDKAMVARGPSGWISEAPIEEVEAYAKQLKMNVPTQFQT